MEERTTEFVVDARDEGLLVRALLEPRDHVRLSGQNRVDQPRDILGLELQVGGIKNQHAPVRLEISGAQRFGDAALRAVAHRSQERILRAELLEQRPASIGRAIVDDHDFVAGRLVPKRRLAQLKE